jgi:hypothetical protein
MYTLQCHYVNFSGSHKYNLVEKLLYSPTAKGGEIYKRENCGEKKKRI